MTTTTHPRVYVCDTLSVDMVRCRQRPANAQPVARAIVPTVVTVAVVSAGIAVGLATLTFLYTSPVYVPAVLVLALAGGVGALITVAASRARWLLTVAYGTWRLRHRDEIAELDAREVRAVQL